MTEATMIETSAEIGELAKALAMAQGEIKGASKDSVNPHFGKSYADLASVWDACRGPLTKHGLSVAQFPIEDGDKHGVLTTLLHSSGQWMRSALTMKPERPGPQAIGSVITYCRRFALASVAGVAPEDDDAESGSGRDKNAKPPGANWGPKSAPKAVAPATTGAPSRIANSTSKPLTTGPTTATNDSGEVLDPGQLQDLTEAFEIRWGKGARTAAPSWLRAKFGTNDVSALTKVQATEALGELLASAS